MFLLHRFLLPQLLRVKCLADPARVLTSNLVGYPHPDVNDLVQISGSRVRRAFERIQDVLGGNITRCAWGIGAPAEPTDRGINRSNASRQRGHHVRYAHTVCVVKLVRDQSTLTPKS